MAIKEQFKPIEIQPIHEAPQEKMVEQQRTIHAVVPEKIARLSDRQQQLSYEIAKTMGGLPGIETRPQIAKALDEIVKTKGEAIQAAKALVNEKEQVYSLEINMRSKPVILTISIDDRENSTTILLTNKEGKMLEGFYNQSRKS